MPTFGCGWHWPPTPSSDRGYVMATLAPKSHTTAVFSGSGPRWLRPLSIAVALHGLIHLVGTVRKFNEASDGDTADYLGGWWEITDATTLRTLGVIWAVVAAIVVAAAVPIWRHDRRWPTILLAASAVSLTLTVVSLWSAVLGVAANLALLGVAYWAYSRRPAPTD